MNIGHGIARAKVTSRALAVLCVFAALAGLLTINGLHAQVVLWIAAIEPLFSAHPVAGRLLFVVLAALSAVLAFFSSTLVVPPAVQVWGMSETILLVWMGWWLGGVATYVLGRWMQEPVQRLLTRRGWSEHVPPLPPRLSWFAVLTLQLALPSEVPGYLCGMLRVPFRVYATALGVAEVPYAVGAVLAARGILQGQFVWLLALGGAAALAMVVGYRLLPSHPYGHRLH